ncbi:putative glycoprotein 2-beta-D-xylosyltransferase [Dioscorea sansibarensis]
MSRRQRARIVRAVVFLFFINVGSVTLYLLLHPRPSSHHREALTLASTPPFPSLKPWPSLPSFMPWLPPPNPRASSCEAFFGHGFSRGLDVLPISPSASGWFRCHYSETLMSSVCEGGGIRMDPGRIEMSRGGETLNEVIGRTEDQELPKFDVGAFEIERDMPGGSKVVDEAFLKKYVPRGQVAVHTMLALLDSMRVVEPGKLECSLWIDEPTVLVTRFEYANLFHTVTDWYSAYVSSRITDLPKRPHLVFVDGHCKAPLEETWKALFSSVTYAKNFSGPVCFRHAILSPLGYETALFKGLTEPINCHGTTANILRKDPDDMRTARLSEFGEMLRAAFGLLGDGLETKPTTGHNVLFVRREDYLAHPRHSGKIESRLSNEQEVFDSVNKWASHHSKCKINVVNGLFAHMHMKEQFQAIQEASVVIGAHGAGLTHLVAATPNTIVLEIISGLYRRPHFSLISQWKGLKYHAIDLSGSHAKPDEVIAKLSMIMQSLGC